MNNKFNYDSNLSHKQHNAQTSSLLIEKITRERVFESLYYNQYCFNLNAATLLDRAVEIHTVGGFLPRGSPLPFLCLLVKLIQILPDREIIEFYITQTKFKYLKVLALVYFRIVHKDYEYLKKLSEIVDYRKIRMFNGQNYELSYMDEIVDNLINDDFFIGLKLTYMKKTQ